MRITTFGELQVSERFKTPNIRNHPYALTVWRKLNDSYIYLSENASFDMNAESSYCRSAFKQHDLVWSLTAEEAEAQDAIYDQWCTVFVSAEAAKAGELALCERTRRKEQDAIKPCACGCDRAVVVTLVQCPKCLKEGGRRPVVNEAIALWNETNRKPCEIKTNVTRERGDNGK